MKWFRSILRILNNLLCIKYGEGSPLCNFLLHILFLNKTLLKSQFKITNKTTGTIISHIQKKEASSMLASLAWWTMTGSNCRHPACKAGALPAELIVHVVTRPGIEPGIPPWKGGVLTAWPTGQNGSSSRTRTYDRSVNSRLLYRLSYRGMVRLLLYVRLIIKASLFFKITIK